MGWSPGLQKIPGIHRRGTTKISSRSPLRSNTPSRCARWFSKVRVGTRRASAGADNHDGDHLLVASSTAAPRIASKQRLDTSSDRLQACPASVEAKVVDAARFCVRKAHGDDATRMARPCLVGAASNLPLERVTIAATRQFLIALRHASVRTPRSTTLRSKRSDRDRTTFRGRRSWGRAVKEEECGQYGEGSIHREREASGRLRSLPPTPRCFRFFPPGLDAPMPEPANELPIAAQRRTRWRYRPPVTRKL